MALADVTASIVRLLATPDDGKCSYPTRGTSPLMQDTFPGIAQTISSKQPPAETLSGTRQGEDANDTGVSDMRKAEEQSTRHSEDFTSVVWFGEQYQFNKGLQAASVKCLWKAWKNGTPSLSQETIGERSGSAASNFRLAHVFRNLGKTHPAWGKMIVSAGKGMFKLAEPETECPTE